MLYNSSFVWGNVILKTLLGFNPFKSARRSATKWYPDLDYLRSREDVLLYSDTEKFKWGRPGYTAEDVDHREMKIRNYQINFGPNHPCAHGVLRLILELDSEVVVRADPHIGLLHRGSEKLMEYKTYNQALPYVDRLDYTSPMSYEHCFCMAVEKLLGIDVPIRAKFIRVLMLELTRVMHHCLSTSGALLDLGAITPFFWMFEEREKLYEIYERVSGARMHSAYIRVGGVAQDIPLGLLDDIYEINRKLPMRVDEMQDIVDENPLMKERMIDIGVISAQDAISHGLTGVMLRGSGVKWDLRKHQPYEIYDELEFDVPIGTKGDCYDRYLVRCEELRQSLKLMEQIMNKMPTGEVKTDDYKISPPPRAEMKTSMEALIHHFKLFSQGYQVPPGATYTAVEAPKGEFAVYMVSDGSSKPYRCKLRTPGFMNLSAINTLAEGGFLADLVAILGSLDIVFGDIDR